MLELFLGALVSFFVVINPAGVAVAFATLAEGSTFGWRLTTALRAVLVSAIVLAGFALGGQWLLEQLQVSLDAFRIAGGALLFLIAVDMLFERRQQRREETTANVAERIARGEMNDVSVFPLAIPLTAGPGAIATTLLYMTDNPSLEAKAMIAAAGASVLAATFLAMLAVGPITRIMGATVLMVLIRIFGIMLAAIAAQFVIDGAAGAAQAIFGDLK